MDAVERWTRHLRATGRSTRTIASYRSDVEQFRRHVDGKLLSASSGDITAHLEAMVSRGLQVTTAIHRYRSLQQFYGWLYAKHHVGTDPTASVAAPSEANDRTDVMTDRELAALLGACSDANTSGRLGRIGLFESRRDTAIVVLLMTTGLTTAELIGLVVTDVRLDRRTVRLVGRDERARVTPILPLTADAIEKYLAARRTHRAAAESSSLWIGERGALTASGLRQLLARRSGLAGIRPITSSHFRRTFAHEAMRRGMSEVDLAALGGWGSARAVRRYRSARP